MTALALNNVTARFGDTPVLGPLSLTLAPGECVALVGKSGAGKSTLLSLLYDEAGSRAAYMPQELGLVDTLSVFHNVFMGRLNHHRIWYNVANLVYPFRAEREVIEPILRRLALAEKMREPAGELSGGQRQRTAVARTLHQRAELLLADEPVSALDGPLAHEVMKALTESYSTAVIALHDVDLALQYCQRIVGIRDGQIALDEPSARLTTNDLQPLY